MARSCRLVRDGRSAGAQWRRAGDSLVLTPSGQPPFVIPIERVAGIAGDGYAIRLRLPAGEVSLERLGADGPTLLSELRRDWPPLRAAALRLAGDARPVEFYTGTIAAPALSGAFLGFLCGSRFLVAVDGGDVTPLFAADWASVSEEEGTYAVTCAGWDGSETVLSKLGGRIGACAAALRAAREGLARDADAALARHLPTLGAVARAELAAQWLPGRLLSVERLESIGPGFDEGFTASWLAAMTRAREGRDLMAGLPRGERHLGYSFPGGSGNEETPHVWLLVRREGVWILELLSHGDNATYTFAGGDELPGLIEGLIRLPEFSREALYLPLPELVDDRSAYAIPAADLPLLLELRNRFSGRKIHNPR